MLIPGFDCTSSGIISLSCLDIRIHDRWIFWLMHVGRHNRDSPFKVVSIGAYFDKWIAFWVMNHMRKLTSACCTNVLIVCRRQRRFLCENLIGILHCKRRCSAAWHNVFWSVCVCYSRINGLKFALTRSLTVETNLRECVRHIALQADAFFEHAVASSLIGIRFVW